MVEEDLLDRPVAGAQRFEDADHAQALEHQDDQAGDQVNDGKDGHDGEQDALVGILYVQPVEDVGIDLADGLRFPELGKIGPGKNGIARRIHLFIVVEKYFIAADLVFAPAIQPPDQPQVADGEGLVVFLDAGLVNPHDRELVGAHGAIGADEIDQHAVVQLEAELLGRIGGHNDLARIAAVGEADPAALLHEGMHMGGVVLNIQAFEQHAFHVFSGFQDRVFGGERVGGLYARHLPDVAQQGHVGLYRSLLGNGCFHRLARTYAHMPPKAEHLAADGFLEAVNEGKRD